MGIDDVLAARGKVYGEFLQQARVSRSISLAILDACDLCQPILQADQIEALYMMAVKIARIINGDPNYVDNWDDIAGYATLVANRLRKDAAK